MKNIVRLALAVASLLFVSGSIYAASSVIGVQFSGDGNGGVTILTPTNAAGALSQTNWNIINTLGGGNNFFIDQDISGELQDGAGNRTTVRLRYSGDDSWNNGGTAISSGNRKLTAGELKEDPLGTNAGVMTLTFTNLGAGPYDVYVYGAVDGGPTRLSVAIGGVTYYWEEPAAGSDTLTQAPSSTKESKPGVGNYMVFTNIPPVSGAITAVLTYLRGGTELGITGLQLVSANLFPPSSSSPPTYTAKIGVEFSGGNRGTAGVLAPDETAGYIVQPNWNVIDTVSGGVNQGASLLLQDNATNLTAVGLLYDSDDAWSTDGGSFTSNDRLMKGYLAEDNAGVMTLTFTNLGAGPYDVYLYGNILDGPSTVSVGLGATTYYWTEPPAFNGFLKQAALSTDSANPGVGNFMRLSGVSPDVNGSITLTVTFISGSEAGIAGLQLCSPSTAFPRGPFTILPQPSSKGALGGDTVSLLSGAGGGVPPISYQWQKNAGSGWVNVLNDSRISGATSGTLTIANAGSADSASYHLVATDSTALSITSSVANLSVVAAVVGVDFTGDADTPGQLASWALAATDRVGLLVQSNWNTINNSGGGGNPSALVGTSGPLVDHRGTATQVRLAYSADDAWNCPGGELTDNNGKLMMGVLKQDVGLGGTTFMTLSFTNLNAGTYDVYLYGDEGDDQAEMIVSVGADTYYWLEPQNFQGTFTEAAHTSDSANPGVGNYLHLTGLSPDVNGTITFTLAWVAYGAPYSEIGIAAIQLVRPTGNFSATGVSISAQPTPSVLYAGGTATFTVGAVTGFPPLSYHWQTNSGSVWVNVANGARISGATSASLTIANVGVADALSYRVIVSDGGGNSATSSVTTLTIAAPPVANSYAAMALANKPLAYYRLNEAAGTTNVYDYVGDHNGYYEANATVGVAGVPNPPYAGFEAGNTCFQPNPAQQRTSFAHAPFGTLAGMSNVTFTMWIYPNVAPQASGSAGLIVDRSGPGAGGGLMYSGDGTQLRSQWGTTTFDSGFVIPALQWSFCALVISSEGATLYLYNANGLAVTNDPTPLEQQTFGGDWHLGNDATDANPNQTFDGLIDEVIIYGSSLSANQINGLYLAAKSGLGQALSIAPSGQNVVLTWSQGALLQAPVVTGPWTTNSAATSPYTNAAAGSQFYRLLIPVVP